MTILGFSTYELRIKENVVEGSGGRREEEKGELQDPRPQYRIPQFLLWFLRKRIAVELYRVAGNPPFSC